MTPEERARGLWEFAFPIREDVARAIKEAVAEERARMYAKFEAAAFYDDGEDGHWLARTFVLNTIRGDA